jgi:hypothetical protein
MKMLAPELSPATVFWSQLETKIAKWDIGEAQLLHPVMKVSVLSNLVQTVHVIPLMPFCNHG